MMPLRSNTVACATNAVILVAALMLVMALPEPAYGAIYKWVDDKGVTHYSESAPDAAGSANAKEPAREVSDEVSDAGNFTRFNEVAPIEYYRPERKQQPAFVNVNIETFDYELGKAEQQRIQQQVRGLYQAYVRWFGWAAQPRQPITIKIFGKYDGFEQYQVDTRGRFITNRSFYSPYHREILMLGSSFADQTLQVLLHEASHAVMDMQIRRASKWFNEGLACMFEGLVWHNNDIRLRTTGGWSEFMQHKLREGSLQAAADYLNIADSKWGSESGRVESMYYTIAWSLMRFLTSSESGVQALATALHRQRTFSGQPGELQMIVGAAYPGGLARLDADWRLWIESL